MYGYKALLEAARRGDTYEKGIIPETPRIHCRQRTLNRNREGLTRARRVVPCYVQTYYMNQLGALRCWECNPNDYQNWKLRKGIKY